MAIAEMVPEGAATEMAAAKAVAVKVVAEEAVVADNRSSLTSQSNQAHKIPSSPSV